MSSIDSSLDLRGKLAQLAGRTLSLFGLARTHAAASITPNLPHRLMILTEGEKDRALALPALQAFFTEKNRIEFSDSDFIPGTPADFQNPRMSVMQHPGVSKGVAVLASLAASSLFFESLNHDFLCPGDYLIELRLAIGTCENRKAKRQFKRKADEFLKCLRATTGIRDEIKLMAQDGRRKMFNNAKILISFCKIILSDWHEQIPSPEIASLLTELERLDTAMIQAQLKFFGLADLIPMEGK